MNPEYKKRLEEAEEEYRRRRTLQGSDAPTKIPNLERMPWGCWMWVLGLLAVLVYVVVHFVTKRPA